MDEFLYKDLVMGAKGPLHIKFIGDDHSIEIDVAGVIQPIAGGAPITIYDTEGRHYPWHAIRWFKRVIDPSRR